MKGHHMSAFGYPRPSCSITGEGDLFATEARLVANHGTRAALTRQATTHAYPRWFALDRKVKLSTTTGCVAGGHESAP